MVPVAGGTFNIKMKKSLLVALVLSFLADNILCYQWEYFTYAQTWPPGVCAEASHEHHQCAIPTAVKTWTVHGLWPSDHGSREPQNCNHSWPFDLNKVATIRADLDTYWPNLFNDTSVDSFWSHEWSKHGTCCTDLAATPNELAYFTQGIVLNRKFDISSILADSGIIPSMIATYSLKDFMNAIQKSVGEEPVIECQERTFKNGTKFHMIGQIEICLDKTFSPISCYKASSWKDRFDNWLDHFKVEMESTGTAEDDTLYFKKRHSRKEPQSNCPKSYNFYYPPIGAVLE